MTLNELKDYLEPQIERILDRITSLETKLVETEARFNKETGDLKDSVRRQGERIGRLETNEALMGQSAEASIRRLETRLERAEGRGRFRSEMIAAYLAVAISLAGLLWGFLT